MKILVLHGPNLNLLGTREPDVYGTETLTDIDSALKELAQELSITIETFQSNHEGVLIDRIHSAKNDNTSGIILNPGGLTHTSVSLRDAVVGVALPIVEVHLSNILAREEFRHHSYITPVAVGQVSGFGAKSYLLALHGILAILNHQ
ncbi:MAG: type II 3-dehydroquinate dehydratase [Desulfuromonas sp.]|nr:MAG: type II 3-dehydroquinate dehydratase [Desulfuromonas sp.]